MVPVIRRMRKIQHLVIFGFVAACGWAQAKDIPAINGLPSASAITYGQALSASTLTGGSASTAGEFRWYSPTTVPASAGDGEFEVIFVPGDLASYDTVITNIVLTVNKATQTPVAGSLGGASILFTDTTTVAISGGSGTGEYEARQNGGTGEVSLTGAGVTRTLTPTAVGTALIEVRRLGDTNYENSAWESAGTLSISKGNQTITFGALPAKAYGDSFDLSATASSGLAVSYTSSDLSRATIINSTVTIVGVGEVNITAQQPGDSNFNPATPVTNKLTIAKANQTITFGALPAKTNGDPAFDLQATASSGLTVRYTSSNHGVATVAGSTVTIVGEGTTTITAIQDGGTYYKPATNVTQDLLVKTSQTITFDPLAERTVESSDGQAVSGPSFELSATTTSPLPVSYQSSNEGVATVAGGTLTVVGAGETTITASQPGNDVYGPATSVPRTLKVNKKVQAIAFDAPAEKIYGDAAFDLPEKADSGLLVSYESSNTDVATIAGRTVTIMGVGSAEITASQAGNDVYGAATAVKQTLAVKKASQASVAGSLGSSSIVMDGTTTVTISGGSGTGEYETRQNGGTGAVGFSGTGAARTLTPTVVGTAVIEVRRLGDTNYEDSAWVEAGTLVISKADQTITFGALPPKAYGDPAFELPETASSGLPVSYTSSDLSRATIINNIVTIVGVGEVNITARQPGDSNYNPATPVIQLLDINEAEQTITFGPLDSKTVGDPVFDLAATASSGLPVRYTSSNEGVATVAGSTVTIVGEGVTTITAKQDGGTYYKPAADATQELRVKSHQTITFGPLASKTYGDSTFELAATASSMLPVSYESSNKSVATVSGSTVTIVGAGSTDITASQAGDGVVGPAAPVIQTLTVNKASQGPVAGLLGSSSIVMGGTTTVALSGGSGTGEYEARQNGGTGAVGFSGTGATRTLTPTEAGTAVIEVRRLGDTNYEDSAWTSAGALAISKADQTITFGALSTKTYGDPTFELAATASSMLPVSYESSNKDVATISGSTVTIVAAGSTDITASQAGDGVVGPAAPVIQTLTVNKASQALVTGSLGSSSILFTNTTTVAISGGSGTGGYEARQNGGTGEVSLSGAGATRTLTPTAVGTALIEVRRLGDTNYEDSAWTSVGTLTIGGTAGIEVSGDAAFGSADVKGGTVVRTFTIRNTGIVPLQLSGTPAVAVLGSHAGDFTVSAAPAVTSVAAGSTTTFQVTFDPSVAGLRAAQLRINNNSAVSPLVVDVQGTGIQPHETNSASGLPWVATGRIEVEDFDKGGEGVAYSDTTPANLGGQYRLTERVDISRDANASNRHVVGWTMPGEWMEYTINVATSGVYTLETQVAAKGTGGQFRVRVDGADVTGALVVPNTGAWNRYQTVTRPGIALPAGNHVLRLEMVAVGSVGFAGAFDWMTLVRQLPGSLQFSAAGYTAAESGGSVLITVSRTGGTLGTATVEYATTSGTAEADADFEGVSGTLTWADGESAPKTFTVPILADEEDDAGEVFNIALSNATGATLGAPSAAAVEITETVSQTIQCEDFDAGGQGVAYNDTTVANLGGKYRPAERVDIAADASAGNGHVVGWTVPGEWLQYSIRVPAGLYVLDTRVATLGTGGKFRLWVDGKDVSGALAIPNTGAWNVYTTVSKSGIALTAGSHVIRLEMVSNSNKGAVGAFDWIGIRSLVRQTYPSGTPWPVPGTIECENFDQGGSGTAYSDTTATNLGGKYRTSEAVDIYADAKAMNGYVVGSTAPGEWMEYTVKVATAGTYTLNTRAAALGTGGQFRVMVDGTDVTGALAIPNTGAWNVYTIVPKTGINLAAGNHTVRLVMVSNTTKGAVGAFDRMEFVLTAAQIQTLSMMSVEETSLNRLVTSTTTLVPQQVQTSDDSLAWSDPAALTDGKDSTVWEGAPAKAIWWILFDYGQPVWVSDTDIVFASAWPDAWILRVSTDGKTWTDADPLWTSGAPVRTRYLWFVLPARMQALPPRIGEIRVEAMP